MRVDVAVCGKFHFPKYLRYLADAGVLGRFYFSHKLTSRFGLDRKHLFNYPLKEYLMYPLEWVLPGRLFPHALRWLHRFWDVQVSRNPAEADLLHVLVHGNASRTIAKYKRDGAVILGEAVNAHPFVQRGILSRECQQQEMAIERMVEKQMLEEFDACDYILVPSRFVYRSFIDQGTPSEKLVLLPYGLDISGSNPAKRLVPEKAISLLLVGKIGCRKGQKYLLEALGLLADEGVDVRLTLVGAADPHYLAGMALPDNVAVTHKRHIPNSEMIGFMKGFDMLVLPSLEDGFGIVVAEALSAGVPVVVSSNAGAADLVEDGVNGFVFSAGDVGQLYQVLKRSLGYEFQVGSISGTDWRGYSDALLTIYRRICTEGVPVWNVQ